ncbi:ABC transporter substrate-binding protein [Corynebacterium hansenii]|uniref:ABC transporter substrate-binding protein n=1 Tax=Corynebacterium hansenii TaxID=394964 RepID=A0ABV7ZKI1_9CORY|nr:ABC transporter substrate-binding protein [Corynebacterium hansenii]WJY99474.1 putative monoacyl phosphatidylinositol tetramannoside-binding protein LpqW precursor [Corynebacterium hansenii]
MFERQNRRRRTALFGSLAAAVLLSGCMANPGDAPTVGEEEPRREDPVRSEESAKQIRVGVDAFGEGFNPHLIADASPVTDLVASLTLPSAFEPDPRDPERWRMSPDLLESAEIVPVDEPVPDEDAGAAGRGDGSGDGAAAEGSAPSIAAEAAEADATDARPGDTRIRYRIRPGAQWSDGTPISGSDFRYLHASLLANAGVVDASAYERIKAITVSSGGRQVDVLVSGPMPEWRTLFRHLLPSHLLRPSATPFVDILDGGLPASGGRYTAQSIDVGRGEVRLVRNDRFWGDVPAKTDTVIVRSVDGAVTGAEQLRAAQLQALRLRPQQTTALTYGLVPGAVELPATLPRQLTLHANVASPLLDDVSVRRAVFSAVDVRAVAAIATGRTDDLEIPAPPKLGSSRESADGGERRSLAGIVDGVTENDPLLIGVMGEDQQAVAAARAIADQLTAAGLPAKVTGAGDQELAGSLLPHGRVDMVVAWNDVADSPQRAASRWSCPYEKRASVKPSEEAASPSTETSARSGRPTSESSAPGSSAPRESGGDRDAGQGARGDRKPTPAASPDVARGSNLSGLCDPRIDAMLDEAVTRGGTGAATGARGLGATVAAPEGSVPAEIRDAIDAEAIELGIVVDRILTVMGPGVELPMAGGAAGNPAEWPAGPRIGPLMTLPDWRRVPSATASDGADPGDERGAGPGADEAGDGAGDGAGEGGAGDGGAEPRGGGGAGGGGTS